MKHKQHAYIHFSNVNRSIHNKKELRTVRGILRIDPNYVEVVNDSYVSPLDANTGDPDSENNHRSYLSKHYLARRNNAVASSSPRNSKAAENVWGRSSLDQQCDPSCPAHYHEERPPSMLMQNIYDFYNTSTKTPSLSDSETGLPILYVPSMEDDDSESSHQLPSIYIDLVEKNKVAENLINKTAIKHTIISQLLNKESHRKVLSSSKDHRDSIECKQQCLAQRDKVDPSTLTESAVLIHERVPVLKFLLTLIFYLLLWKNKSTQFLSDITVENLEKLERYVQQGCILISSKASLSVRTIIEKQRTNKEIPMATLEWLIKYFWKTCDTKFDTSEDFEKCLYLPFTFYSNFSAESYISPEELKYNIAEMMEDPLLASMGDRFNCIVAVNTDLLERSVQVEIFSDALELKMDQCQSKLEATLSKYGFCQFKDPIEEFYACATPKLPIVGGSSTFLEKAKLNFPEEMRTTLENWVQEKDNKKLLHESGGCGIEKKKSVISNQTRPEGTDLSRPKASLNVCLVKVLFYLNLIRNRWTSSICKEVNRELQTIAKMEEKDEVHLIPSAFTCLRKVSYMMKRCQGVSREELGELISYLWRPVKESFMTSKVPPPWLNQLCTIYHTFNTLHNEGDAGPLLKDRRMLKIPLNYHCRLFMRQSMTAPGAELEIFVTPFEGDLQKCLEALRNILIFHHHRVKDSSIQQYYGIITRHRIYVSPSIGIKNRITICFPEDGKRDRNPQQKRMCKD